MDYRSSKQSYVFDKRWVQPADSTSLGASQKLNKACLSTNTGRKYLVYLPFDNITKECLKTVSTKDKGRQTFA